ncbi:MAG: tetratricopeptide repeat protein [Rhodocyclaceae bacterium]|nr:tetratricopeptide repeat protein [Rhodocyclaceae bacterium]
MAAAPTLPDDPLPAAFGRYRHGDAAGALAALEADRDAWRERPDGWVLLGVLHRGAGRLPEAEAAYREALRLKPDYGDAWHNLGNLYAAAGLHEAAVAAYEAGLRTGSASAGPAALAVALSAAAFAAGDAEKALAAARAAVAADPASGAALNQLGKMLWELGDAEAARAAFAEAVARAPGETLFAVNRLLVSQFSPAMTEEGLSALARAAAARVLAGVPAGLRREIPRAPVAGRRIRVAYLSSDFRQSAPGVFIETLLAGHDRQRFEVWALSNSPAADERTAAMRGHADRWLDVWPLHDAALTERIRGDGIDILVDLNGYTGGHRLGVLAARAAPVQITWLGYEGTTQVPGVDAILADRHVAPPGNAGCYSERILRLPFDFCCYAPHPAAPSVAPAPAVARGHVTFGSFNKLAKITEPTLDLWARVLAAVPGSRLLLKWRFASSPSARNRILEGFARRGIAAARIELREASPYLALLAEYADLDVALDPLPFSGGATTCDALWMGVPVVTLRGRRFASNHTVGHLTAAGLPELVAETEDEYVGTCARLAADPPALGRLRAGLRDQVAASPLAAPRLFAMAVERHYLDLLD